MTRFFIIMGVSGCGKTSVGSALAARLGCPFYDGDDFHSPESVAKMTAGMPLSEEERLPWLDRLAGLVEQHMKRGEAGVLACSALRRSYRDRLRKGDNRPQFVYLNGEFEQIQHRMQLRKGHYMQAGMLQSQFQTLEEPGAGEAIVVDIEQSVGAIVDEILARVGMDGV